jgi:hypothetical protein
MDLTQYYEKVRLEEGKIEGKYALVVSCESGDGGKPGQHTEVTKRVAAQLIVAGTARLATPEEAEAHRAIQTEALRKLAEQESAATLRMSVVSTADLEELKSAAKSRR